MIFLFATMDHMGDMEVNTSTDISIIVTPSSENDFADYASGLSVADGVELGEYLDNQTNSITGNPYKIVAADVNFSNSITVDDKDMIYDLIIGRIQNFDRNSWEWFNEADITNNSTSFNSNHIHLHFQQIQHLIRKSFIILLQVH